MGKRGVPGITRPRASFIILEPTIVFLTGFIRVSKTVALPRSQHEAITDSSHFAIGIRWARMNGIMICPIRMIRTSFTEAGLVDASRDSTREMDAWRMFRRGPNRH